MSPESVREIEAPPAGEELHLPGPSVVPLLNATGIALALVGLTLSWWLVGGGALLFLVTAAVWIRHTIRDIDELPLEH